MKLMSIHLARSIWLFPVNDLNPRGRAVMPDLLSEAGKRYGFTKIPTGQEALEARQTNKGITYAGGSFKNLDGINIEVNLIVYSDGLLAESRSSTADCDHFLKDLLNWTKEIGFTDHEKLPTKKIYVSELHFSMAKSLNLINPNLGKFFAILNAKSKAPIKSPEYETGAIGFWLDPEHRLQTVQFRIERAETAPFSEDRFYSIAPFETDDHLMALEAFENLL